MSSLHSRSMSILVWLAISSDLNREQELKDKIHSKWGDLRVNTYTCLISVLMSSDMKFYLRCVISIFSDILVTENWLTVWLDKTLNEDDFVNSLRPNDSKLTIIGSDDGLSPGRRQGIIWTSAVISLTGPVGINFREILIEIHTTSVTKLQLKMSSVRWRTFSRPQYVVFYHLCTTYSSVLLLNQHIVGDTVEMIRK